MKEGGGGALMHVYLLEHIISLSYRTTWWMFTKLDRDEVLIITHLFIGFSANSTQGRIQGGGGQFAKNRSMRGSFSKGLLLQIGMQQQQTECIPISWIWSIAIVAVLTDFTNMAVMLSDLLRNLTFNRSAHCTQVSDQCPLGLLFSTSFLSRWQSDSCLWIDEACLFVSLSFCVSGLPWLYFVIKF